MPKNGDPVWVCRDRDGYQEIAVCTEEPLEMHLYVTGARWDGASESWLMGDLDYRQWRRLGGCPMKPGQKKLIRIVVEEVAE